MEIEIKNDTYKITAWIFRKICYGQYEAELCQWRIQESIYMVLDEVIQLYFPAFSFGSGTRFFPQRSFC